jgi:hypothetical protein
MPTCHHLPGACRCLTLEVLDAGEVVLLHEGLQPAAELLDQRVAMQHDAGAHLRSKVHSWV